MTKHCVFGIRATGIQATSTSFHQSNEHSRNVAHEPQPSFLLASSQGNAGGPQQFDSAPVTLLQVMLECWLWLINATPCLQPYVVATSINSSCLQVPRASMYDCGSNAKGLLQLALCSRTRNSQVSCKIGSHFSQAI